MIKCRLNLLADRLEKIEATPLKKRKRFFDIGTWVRFGDVRTDGVCGTAACAVGEATFMQRFRDLGLRWSKRHHDPAFKGELGWYAVHKFFGLNNDEAEYLFTGTAYRSIVDPDRRSIRPSSKVTPGLVAARIREFVKTGVTDTETFG